MKAFIEKMDCRQLPTDVSASNSGAVVKKPLSKEDIDIVVRLFREIKPQQLYAAGDLSDPHGTHRTCLQVFALPSTRSLLGDVCDLMRSLNLVVVPNCLSAC